MEETFVALCELGDFVLRKEVHELYGNARSIDHFVLGISCVYANAFDFYFCGCCVEILKFQFANVAAVHRVGPFAAKFFNVELVGT